MRGKESSKKSKIDKLPDLNRISSDTCVNEIL